jgi:hypothetical protein
MISLPFSYGVKQAGQEGGIRMKQPLDRWLERLQFTLLFLAVTVFLHGMFGWFHSWLRPIDPYKVPEGRAFKVFHTGEGNDPAGSPGDRLRLFFWLGE